MAQVNKSGFTLVELAIVMTIIGLLIGGILKGQELLENARVTSTIAQVKSYEAAVTGFQDIYGGLPGDLVDAGNRIPGCNQNCTPSIDAYSGDGGKAGDGYVGGNSFLEETFWGGDTLSHPPVGGFDESILFWAHLLKANLIAGVSDEALTTANTPVAFGVTHPAAKIGGGFQVGSQVRKDGFRFPGSPAGDDTVALGASLVSVLVADDMYQDRVDPAKQPLTPGRARQIDSKMDDGAPMTGTVHAYGTTTSCFADDGNDGYAYDSSLSSKDCGLVFMLKN